MRKVTLILGLIIGISCAYAKSDKPNMKFVNEAASIVWNDLDANFNPKAELTDSMFINNSATYIAVHKSIDAKRRNATPSGPYSRANREYFGETTIDYFTHYMVKLNDHNAIDEFSYYKFDAKVEQKISSIIIYSAEEAFGARIHKPDGKVVDVDVSEALPETDGKNDKATTFRIAIPGLEVGDVLEYFMFTRYYMFGDQSIGADVDLFLGAPTSYYKFTGVFDKILTIEFNTFNSLTPDLFYQTRGADRDSVTIQLNNIEHFDTPKFCNKKRQVPYFRVRVADNYSKIFGVPKSARRPGLYFNLTTPIIMAEVAEQFATRSILPEDIKKAWNLVKEYRKNNPDATWQDIADTAWLATLYISLLSNENYNEWDVCAIFKDIIDKAKLEYPARLSVTTSHNQIPILNIASYRQATPLVLVGNRPYLHDYNLVYRPGELPGIYHGEVAITLDGPRDQEFNYRAIGIDTLAESRHRDNTETIDINVSFDPNNNERLNFDYTNVAKGASKNLGSAFLNSNDIIKLTEEYLNVKENKRSKQKFDIIAIDDSRRKALEAVIEVNLNLQNLNIDSVSILSPGFLPTNPTFEYRIIGNIDGLITYAGDDILLKVGNLVGASAFSKLDRTKPRDIEIYTPGPYNDRHNLKIKVPDGYTVNPQSLNQLQVNVANLCGSYYTQSSYDAENNIVTIITNYRNNRRVYPSNMWNEFVNINEAAVAFTDATIVFVKK